jgi:hypothetical protein
MSSGPLAALERYLDATAVSPPLDLVEHISARLLLEPSSTAPRRYLVAVRALDLRAIARGLAQNATAAFRPGPRSMLLRTQAMAIVLVTLATVGFGSVAGLAATQQVAQHVVKGLAAWSQGSITSPAAPAAPKAPSIEQLEPQRANDSLGGADPGDLPRSRGALGQGCGLPAPAEADQRQASGVDGCPGGLDSGRSPANEDRPRNAAGAKGKGEPPAGKGPAKGTAEPPAKRGDGQGKTDPPARRGSDKGKAEPPASKGSDKGKARPQATKSTPEPKRDRGSGPA